MSEFYTFPHIESLARHPEVFKLGEVVALEKVDGTNARFGWVDGTFRIGSRNQEIGPEDPFGFAAWVRHLGFEQRLYDAAGEGSRSGIIVYGEWYGHKIQKGVTYSNYRDFRGFAVRVGRAFLPVIEALEFIQHLGLSTAPLLYRGAPDSAVFDSLRVLPSMTARIHTAYGEDLGVDLDQNFHEGIVIWPSYPFMDCHGEWVIAKHKNPTFLETRPAKVENTPADVLEAAQTFVYQYATPERYRHVVETLRADGADVGSPATIGTILKTFNEDAVREGAPDYDKLETAAQKLARKLLNTYAKQQLEVCDAAA